MVVGVAFSGGGITALLATVCALKSLTNETSFETYSNSPTNSSTTETALVKKLAPSGNPKSWVSLSRLNLFLASQPNLVYSTCRRERS